MYEDFHKFRDKRALPNCFWPVEEARLLAAEAKIGRAFPDQLRTFYREVGYGFYTRGVGDRKQTHVNRVVSPMSVASLMTDPDYEWRPPEGFAEGAMPFFDLGELAYLILLPKSASPNRVYAPDGQTVVSDGLVEFFEQLYRRAAFYRDRF